MKVAGLILAGGQGTRMGRVDKGLQLLCAKPLVAHVIERLRPQVAQLWLNVNRNMEQYAPLNLPMYGDAKNWQGKGPLAGIASFTPHLADDITHIQIAPCDTPFLSQDLVQLLLKSPTSAYPMTERGAHYACALLTRADFLSLSVVPHDLRLQSWLYQIQAHSISEFLERDFININTLAQLHEINTLA